VPDLTGFLKFERKTPPYRPVPLRLMDWREVTERAENQLILEQATRCMNCGIPFCHQGCPLGNLIPTWNDLVHSQRWEDASEALHAANNFPEFTGRLCPAPCEAACVLGIADNPVTIKQVEVEIINRVVDDRRLMPLPASTPTGRSVAVVGSGPAGMAAAQQLARAGYKGAVRRPEWQQSGRCGSAPPGCRSQGRPGRPRTGRRLRRFDWGRTHRRSPSR
jgi:glutamate synthase (NADPH/NADH) small chain